MDMCCIPWTVQQTQLCWVVVVPRGTLLDQYSVILGGSYQEAYVPLQLHFGRKKQETEQFGNMVPFLPSGLDVDIL